MIEEFQSEYELYRRVLPALRYKIFEFSALGYFDIDEKYLWNYLSQNTWKMGNGLTLYDIVLDILQVNVMDVLSYRR